MVRNHEARQYQSPAAGRRRVENSRFRPRVLRAGIPRDKAAHTGTQFGCFTGTKVQILTLLAEELCQRRCMCLMICCCFTAALLLLYCSCPAHVLILLCMGPHTQAAHTGDQFTCFTSTKVQILTPEALQELPNASKCATKPMGKGCYKWQDFGDGPLGTPSPCFTGFTGTNTKVQILTHN